MFDCCSKRVEINSEKGLLLSCPFYNRSFGVPQTVYWLDIGDIDSKFFWKHMRDWKVQDGFILFRRRLPPWTQHPASVGWSKMKTFRASFWSSWWSWNLPPPPMVKKTPQYKATAYHGNRPNARNHAGGMEGIMAPRMYWFLLSGSLQWQYGVSAWDMMPNHYRPESMPGKEGPRLFRISSWENNTCHQCDNRIDQYGWEDVPDLIKYCL